MQTYKHQNGKTYEARHFKTAIESTDKCTDCCLCGEMPCLDIAPIMVECDKYIGGNNYLVEIKNPINTRGEA